MSLDGKVAAVSIGAGLGAVGTIAIFAPYYWPYVGAKYIASGLIGALAGGGLIGALYNGGKAH